MDKDATISALKAALAILEKQEAWTPESLEALLRPLAPELGIKTGQLFGAIRVAVTGRTAAPPLFDTLSVLGKERCVSRVRTAIQVLGVISRCDCLMPTP